MILQIVEYLETGEERIHVMGTVPEFTKVEERILRKAYDHVWKYCNKAEVLDLYAVVIDDKGNHLAAEYSQAWATEYMTYYPNHDLPYI